MCIKIIFYIFSLSNSFSISHAHYREPFSSSIFDQRKIRNRRWLYLDDYLEKLLEGSFSQKSLFLAFIKDMESLLEMLLKEHRTNTFVPFPQPNSLPQQRSFVFCRMEKEGKGRGREVQGYSRCYLSLSSSVVPFFLRFLVRHHFLSLFLSSTSLSLGVHVGYTIYHIPRSSQIGTTIRS